jgi:hypothetical protein
LAQSGAKAFSTRQLLADGINLYQFSMNIPKPPVFQKEIGARLCVFVVH